MQIDLYFTVADRKSVWSKRQESIYIISKKDVESCSGMFVSYVALV